MRPRVACPFCLSLDCIVIQRDPQLAEIECRSCRTRWSEVTADRVERRPPTPRPAPVKVPLRCARCNTDDSIAIERILTGSVATDFFACSRCGGTWPVHAAGKKATVGMAGDRRGFV